jgi:methylene-tetrahydromethanopterin dehydrogenase
VEGVGIKDNGTPIEGTSALGIGALAIGDVKYKTESGLFKEMIEAEKPVYLDFRAAYELAQKLAS